MSANIILFKEQLENIIRLFDEAENEVKKIEGLNGEIVIPSLNELRYVGYHLVRSLCEENESEMLKQIEKAENHCKRAIYDATESGLLYFLENIMAFKRDYSNNSAIMDVLPDYAKYLAEADTARKKIAQIASNGIRDRSNYYKECHPMYCSLEKIDHQFDIARPIISKLIDDKNLKFAKDQRDHEILVKTLVVAIATLVVACIGLLIALMV
ncbi:MAG: hypothetical protein Q9O24_05515 [Gammaproteobacteria bacterium]|nr:hypothetical protein [Gammaproteobacteria bacterium]